jgi:site-specific DNA-methyltransferase (adenine-specific)
MRTENIHLLLVVYQKVAPHAFPYLVMMALRILELHRELKPTGSFYLHCDPTMSHYLKALCDTIWGESNYRNEINWKRANPKSNNATNFVNNRDIIFRYTKSDKSVFNKVFTEHDIEYVDKAYKYYDKNGPRYRLLPLLNPNKDRPNLTYKFLRVTRVWRWTKDRMQKAYKEGLVVQLKDGAVPQYKLYLDQSKGKVITNDWDDILPATGSESLGYPTQKPKALLERIIKASSNEGDVVLDGFCGCGTTIDAAEGLHRKWIGIDISPIAISLIKRRLHHTYKKGLAEFEVRGTPTDEQSAQRLWKENAFAFQDWWITEFEAFSATFGTKGADKGVDGIALYAMDNKDTTARVAFQVKGGEKVQSKDIDALLGAIEKHKCDMGVLLTTTEPTKPMLDTVAGAGFVKLPGFEFPKLQILTLKDFFAGKRPKLPSVNITFKAAQHSGKKKENQEAFEL